MALSEDDLRDVEAETEHEDLPRGSERELISAEALRTERSC